MAEILTLDFGLAMALWADMQQQKKEDAALMLNLLGAAQSAESFKKLMKELQR